MQWMIEMLLWQTCSSNQYVSWSVSCCCPTPPFIWSEGYQRMTLNSGARLCHGRFCPRALLIAVNTGRWYFSCFTFSPFPIATVTTSRSHNWMGQWPLHAYVAKRFRILGFLVKLTGILRLHTLIQDNFLIPFSSPFAITKDRTCSAQHVWLGQYDPDSRTQVMYHEFEGADGSAFYGWMRKVYSTFKPFTQTPLLPSQANKIVF